MKAVTAIHRSAARACVAAAAGTRAMSTRPVALDRSHFRDWHTIASRWSDNDMYGHINNVVYYSYMDTAVNNMLIARGILNLKGSGPACVVAETGMHFFDSSLSYPDVIEVGLRADKIGKSSIIYSVGIFKQGAASTAAVGRFVHVNVDRASLRPLPLTPAALAALEPLQ